VLGDEADEGTGRRPAERRDVIAALRRHGITGTVAAVLWTAARDLRPRARRRGIEHAVTLEAFDGRPVARMLTGDASRTDLTPHLLVLQRDHEYIQMHTHLRSPSFSALDVRVLSDHAAIRTMIAVGADGTWYLMSRQVEVSLGDRHALYDEFLDELIRLQRARIAGTEISHRAVEHVAAQHGLLHDRVTGPDDE
jgi:hypothetical protein